MLFRSAETRVLFRYRLTGKVDKDEFGKLKHIHGYFEQVNPISDSLIQKFFSAGISIDELSDFINVPKQIDGSSNLVSQQKTGAKSTASFLED